MHRGRLIAVEGIDGAGKSTQARRLAEALRAAGRDVVATREPTGGPFGRRIRELARAGRRAPPREELALFWDDRRAHVRDVIAPALAAGRVVVTDRYYLSTAAYQGARGLDPRAILADAEALFPVPDRAVLVEVEPRLGLERVGGRDGGVLPAFEQLELLQAVARVFRELDRPYLARVAGDRPPDAVHRDVLAALGPVAGLV